MSGNSDEIHLDRKRLDDALQLLLRFRISLAELDIHPNSSHGRGGFGIVRMADYHPAPGVSFQVAVKDLISDFTTLPLRIAYRLAREMIVWSKLDHPNILKFIGYHLSDDLKVAYLVSPLIQKGNIAEFILTTQPDTAQRLELIKDTLKGLQYLHGLDPPVIHGDLKSANILVTDDCKALLCDFGLANVMDDELAGLATSTDFKGSTRWCSPEVLMGVLRSPQSDVWAWACLALEIMTGVLPYRKAANDGVVIYTVTVKRDTPEPKSGVDIPPLLLALLRRCWAYEPNQRPDVNDCASSLEGRRWINQHWLDGWLMEYVMDIERAVSGCIHQAEMSAEEARRLLRVSQQTRAELKQRVDEAAVKLNEPNLPKICAAYLQLKISTLTESLQTRNLPQQRAGPSQNGSFRPRAHSLTERPRPDLDGKDIVWEILQITSALRRPVQVSREEVGDMLRALSKLAREFAPLDTSRHISKSLISNFSRLTRSYPNDFHPEVARFLAEDFYDFRIRRGDYELALQAAQEAAERYRDISVESVNYLPELVFALEKVKTVLTLTSRDEEALKAVEEVVELYTRLAKDLPAKWNPSLARALVSNHECLCRVGRGAENSSLQLLTDAVLIYRDLVSARSGPERFEPALASALCDLDLSLVRMNRRDDAILVKNELIQLYNAIGEPEEAAEVERAKNHILRPAAPSRSRQSR